MKLADALLRRKELQAKVDQLHNIRAQNLFEMKISRRQINETIDDIEAQVPKVTASQVTEEYDYYAGCLRKIDGAIQQLNWTSEIEVEASVWENYKPKAA